jgi:hypothetical protein
MQVLVETVGLCIAQIRSATRSTTESTHRESSYLSTELKKYINDKKGNR